MQHRVRCDGRTVVGNGNGGLDFAPGLYRCAADALQRVAACGQRRLGSDDDARLQAPRCGLVRRFPRENGGNRQRGAVGEGCGDGRFGAQHDGCAGFDGTEFEMERVLAAFANRASVDGRRTAHGNDCIGKLERGRHVLGRRRTGVAGVKRQRKPAAGPCFEGRIDAQRRLVSEKVGRRAHGQRRRSQFECRRLLRCHAGARDDDGTVRERRVDANAIRQRRRCASGQRAHHDRRVDAIEGRAEFAFEFAAVHACRPADVTRVLRNRSYDDDVVRARFAGIVHAHARLSRHAGNRIVARLQRDDRQRVL